jgi:hypothetical protein
MKPANLARAIYCRAIQLILIEIAGVMAGLVCGWWAATPNSGKPTACKHGRTGESARHYHL